MMSKLEQMMFWRVAALSMGLFFSHLGSADCSDKSLQGAYASSGQLTFDSDSSRSAGPSIPLSGMLIFDGAGGLIVEDFTLADFAGSQFGSPIFEIAYGDGKYAVKSNCAGTISFDLSLEGEVGVAAEVTMPVVLYGTGVIADGFKGTLNLKNETVEVGGGSGDIGQMEGVRQTLKTADAGIEQLYLTLEEPVSQSTASGVSNIRGWAVAPSGIDRLELLIDDALTAEIPYGGARGDVGDAFPEIANADKSGFGQTFNFGLLGEGTHSISVRAYSNYGGMIERTATFEVAAFQDPFIDDAGFPSFSASSAEVDRRTGDVLLQNVVLEDGSAYDVTLRWSRATQGFEMTKVLGL
jgi:hypothetical protein